MQNFNETVGNLRLDVELKNPYDQAKCDFLKTMESFQKLTPDEKKKLIGELLGEEAVVLYCEVIKKLGC